MEIIGWIFGALTTAFAALVIFFVQERVTKKKAFKALYSEIEENLALALKLLPIARHMFQKEPLGKDVTVFDLKPLYTLSYDDFRRSGYVLLLPEDVKRLLEDVYELVYAHNRQTEPLIHELPFMRSRGYSERLAMLIKNSKLLKDRLRVYV